VFHLLEYSFDSAEAKQLNKDIFECIYYHALEASLEEAQADGAYSTFNNSPLSRGQFQFDLWGVSEDQLSGKWDWHSLRDKIMKHGVRNSLLLAPMPTASTAQILGCNECIEPYTTNLYTRRVSAGDFIMVNPHLVKELEQRGQWTSKTKNLLIASGGSVADWSILPSDVKHRFRTVWEVKQRSLIDMAAERYFAQYSHSFSISLSVYIFFFLFSVHDIYSQHFFNRGLFIDQSQSLNCFMESPDFNKLSNMHLYGWRKGLKTGMYYLRTKPAANAIQFTLDRSQVDDDEATLESGGSES
jgi:ribonucleotide reductase alpha subunit